MRREPVKITGFSKSDKLLWALLTAQKEKLESEPFGPTYSKRSYPGEAEARSLVRYLESTPRDSRQNDVIYRSLWTLQRTEEALVKQKKNKRPSLLKGLRTVIPAGNAISALGKLMSGRKRVVGFTKNGLVVQPVTLQGIAALGMMLLARENRLGRLKHCLHCGAWFYARFKHQSFCSDQEKRCQWNHYHTPEWRKRNRKRNRKHQRELRERIFGKRSK